MRKKLAPNWPFQREALAANWPFGKARWPFRNGRTWQPCQLISCFSFSCVSHRHELLRLVSGAFYYNFYITTSSLVCRPQARLPENLALLGGVDHGRPLRNRCHLAFFLRLPSRREQRGQRRRRRQRRGRRQRRQP